MKHPELVRQHAALKSLIRRAGHAPSTRDVEMLAHWGRYLCVLTSGFVENVVRLIYGAYIDKTSSRQTARFAQRQLGEIQNPKSGRLVDLANSFDASWGPALEQFLEEGLRGESVNSIMTNRHLIVHGRSADITVARVDQYLSRIIEVATYIEAQCGL